MEIVPFGYRELHLVQHDNWCLPIHADPFSSDAQTVTHWCVRPAKQLLAAPFEELSRRFAPHNMGQSRTHWYVSKDILVKFATKANGCDPDQYLKWDKETPNPKESVGIEEVEGPSKVEEKFINFMFKRSAIDPKLGRYFWAALKDSMQHWLIQVQRPIDFELFEVQPIPYRANWKEIMLAKHPGCAAIFRKPKETWKDQLIASGFMQDLGSSDLVAIDSHSKSIAWTLEIQPKPIWTKSMEDAEYQRMVAKKPGNYLRYYESCIRKRLDDTLETFGAWIREIRRPVAKLCESAVTGSQVLLPIHKYSKVLPAWHRPDSVTFEPCDGPRIRQGQSAEKSLSKASQDLLRVPNFQQRHEDLRRLSEARDDGVGERREDADGLRLLHAGEGDAPVIDVLATGNDGKE